MRATADTAGGDMVGWMRWGFVMLVVTLACGERAWAAPTVTLVPDRAAPQAPGTKIRWRATVSNMQSPNVFKWWLWDGSGWKLLRDWSNAAVYDWVPGTANPAYRIRVWVRSSGTNADRPDASREADFAITPPPVSSVTLSADKPVPQPAGTRVRFTASATGGLAPVSYKWWVHDGVTWSLLADWSTSNVFDWTPARSGESYRVGVWARGAGSTADDGDVEASVPFAVLSGVSPCLAETDPGILSFGSGGGTGTAQVTIGNGCVWQVQSQASWITLESPSTRTGAGTVVLKVAPNTEQVSRIGSVLVGGHVLSVTQGGGRTESGCSYAVFPTSIEAGFGNETAEVVVTAPPGCPWSVEHGGFARASRSSGEGTTTLSIAIENNTAPEPRATVVMVAGRAVTVAQAGRVVSPPACSYTVSPLEAAFDFQARTAEVRVTTTGGCAWTASTNDPFVHLVSGASGTGSGTVRYALDANGGAGSRGALLMVAGHAVTVTQAAMPQVPACVFQLSASSFSASYAGGTSAVGVFTAGHCEWGVTSNTSWLRVTEVSESQGNGSVWFAVDANPGDERAGTLVVAGQTFEVTQGGVPRSAQAGDIQWVTPPDASRVGECAGNCGAGCGDFFNPCGGPHHWERQVLTEPQYVGDDWQPVCAGAFSWYEVRPRYTAVVRWTFHGLRSSLCAQHDASCRALELVPGIDKLLCLATAALVGLNGFNYCDGAELYDWSYEFVDVGHGPVAAYIDGAPSC